jgi:hypothetical protein
MRYVSSPIIALWVLLFIAACNHNATQPAPVDLLLQAESTITAGMETLKTAIDLGQVDVNSEAYAAVYAGLKSANEFMDGAWTAYRAGDLSGADSARRLAMSSYMHIRPLLVEMAGGDL